MKGVSLRYTDYMISKNNLPDKIICLSCLLTQRTVNIVKNDGCCVLCGNAIDIYNISDVEV